jgi:hypothetical protein
MESFGEAACRGEAQLEEASCGTGTLWERRWRGHPPNETSCGGCLGERDVSWRLGFPERTCECDQLDDTRQCVVLYVSHR